MKFLNVRNVLLGVGAAGLVAAGSANAQPVDLNINSFNVGYNSVILPAQQLPGGATWSSGYNGVYQFTIDSGPNQGHTFWSTCLSPGGEVDYGAHTYQVESFASANPGSFPSSWATSSDGTQLWGIQNATYLWQQFASGSVGLQSSAFQNGDASSQDAGAALQLAMYVALYDSTGYGAVGGTKFTPATTGANAISSSIINDMNSDLLLLTTAGANPVTGVANHLAAGYMLVPDPALPNAQQEFIILGTEVGNVVVPEPASTSVFGGLIALFAVVGAVLRRKFSARA